MVHDHDEVGQGDGLELGMGDVDEGDAQVLLQPPQLAAHLQAQELVERRQRLVEQQHARLGDQRPRQRHALLLAAGQLRRHAVGEAAICTRSSSSPPRGAARPCLRRASSG